MPQPRTVRSLQLEQSCRAAQPAWRRQRRWAHGAAPAAEAGAAGEEAAGSSRRGAMWSGRTEPQSKQQESAAALLWPHQKQAAGSGGSSGTWRGSGARGPRHRSRSSADSARAALHRLAAAPGLPAAAPSDAALRWALPWLASLGRPLIAPPQVLPGQAAQGEEGQRPDPGDQRGAAPGPPGTWCCLALLLPRLPAERAL